VADNQLDRLSFEDARRIDIIAAVLSQLETSLAPQLYYHSLAHTETVIADALMLAQSEGCSFEEQKLIAIAAAYHDAGFLDQAEQNEPLGAGRAREAMERSQGYGPADINAVTQMILDTTVMQSSVGVVHIPHHALSPYLLDADVANLGRASFWDQFGLLVRELQVEPKVLARRTVSLFEGHRWLTRTAKSMWGTRAEQNLTALREFIEREG
jgi:predicted metal-dependent HD superfamily phosphohydrolase